MIFTGEYEHAIDAKQRLAIPAEIRSILNPEIHGTGFFLAPGSNGALWLWPEKTFIKMAEALEQTLLPEDELQEFQELFFSQASRQELDKTGRIRLPERLLRWGKLEQKIMILGIKDHLELRDASLWASMRQDKLDRLPDIMRQARQALSEQQQSRKQEGRRP